MSRLTCPLFDSFLEPRRSLPLDFSFRSPSRCNERNIRSIRKWLCAPSAVNSDLGSPCCKLQGYCNRVARVGGCKRCRRRGDKGAFTSSAGDPRVPLYLPSVGINCLSPDNGVTPLIPGRGARLCVSLRWKFQKVFLASGQNRVTVFLLSSWRRIFHPVEKRGIFVRGLGFEGMIITRENLLERCTLITFTATLCYQQLRFFVLRSVFIKRSYEYIHGKKTVPFIFRGSDIAA